jgi:hypothetical protein
VTSKDVTIERRIEYMQTWMEKAQQVLSNELTLKYKNHYKNKEMQTS